jgi:uncharacterized protein YyaL (SSP411 family)
LRSITAAQVPFIPYKAVLCADGAGGEEFLSAYSAMLGVPSEKDEQPAVYICDNYSCPLPLFDPE